MAIPLSAFAREQLGLHDAACLETKDRCIAVFQHAEGLGCWLINREGDEIVARMPTAWQQHEDIDLIKAIFAMISGT